MLIHPQRGHRVDLVALANDNARHAFGEKRRASDDEPLENVPSSSSDWMTVVPSDPTRSTNVSNDPALSENAVEVAAKTRSPSAATKT